MSMIRQRTKNLIIAGTIGAVAAAAISVGGAAYFINQQAKEHKENRLQYESRLKDAEALLQKQKATMKSVVVAAKELTAGKKITTADLIKVNIPQTEAPTNMIQSANDLIGKVIKIDIGQNTPLISSMVFDEGPTPNDLRNQEYNVIVLPTKIKKGQFLDVRITFPTGEEFVVLGKKKVKDYSGTTVWFDVSESEMLVMSSAIVDAYLNGAKLSAATYVDPYMQESASPNYPANVKVIDLIQTNPNVLETAKNTLRKHARKILESNLSQISEADKIKIQNGGMILQQQVANTQMSNQQNNQSVSGVNNQNGSNNIDPGNTTTQPGSNENNNTSVVSKEQIVQPTNDVADKTAKEQKEQDVFEQPLVK